MARTMKEMAVAHIVRMLKDARAVARERLELDQAPDPAPDPDAQIAQLARREKSGKAEKERLLSQSPF